MQTVEETRRARLKELWEKHGSYVKLNALIGLGGRDSTLSQIANASKGSKTGTPKTMGSPMARDIEAALKLPPGWMDTPPGSEWPFGDQISPADFSRLTAEELQPAIDVLLGILRRKGSPGNGGSGKPDARAA